MEVEEIEQVKSIIVSLLELKGEEKKERKIKNEWERF